MACEPNYNFTIDGHNMTIIEADGEYTEPLTVDFIQIFAAQRYSFIVRLPVRLLLTCELTGTLYVA